MLNGHLTVIYICVCVCSDVPCGLMRGVLYWLMTHQPSKGFYLADEPRGGSFSSLAAEVAAVRKAAPGALSFINLLPSNVSGVGRGTNAARWAREWGAPNYTAYVRGLVDVVDPDVVCFDHYPTFGRNVAGKRENDTREDYVRNLALAGGVTWEAGIPLWQYFNIVPYGGRHEDPTEAQVRGKPNAIRLLPSDAEQARTPHTAFQFLG